MTPAETLAALEKIAAQRILILDGAMGTLAQDLGFDEAAYRGDKLKDHDCSVKGNHDLLCLTQPEAVAGMHRKYLDAGADVAFVRDWLGHSNIQNTMVYAQLTTTTRDQAARTIFTSPQVI